jgi:hypothetical protein
MRATVTVDANRNWLKPLVAASPERVTFRLGASPTPQSPWHSRDELPIVNPSAF